MFRRLSVQKLMLCGITAVCSVGGCASKIPKNALAMRPQSLEWRQRSTRRFSTTDEKQILSASAGLLQDMGFIIENSESDLGLIVASMDRTAIEGGQVTGKVFVFLLLRVDMPIDRNQKIRASIVTHPSGNEIAVRVTFQRIVWNDRNQICKLEPLDDPKLYQEFFDKLSHAVFLEAHQI
jgi:hypothetical protein